MGVIDSAVKWAVSVANDDTHGYDQGSRWGPDYDCSSLVISAYEQAGAGVKTAGAQTTYNMRTVFLQCGFSDVTEQVNLSSGSGLLKGDVLLNATHHTALVVENNGASIVNASINENNTATGGKTGDQTGKEIYVRGYYNYPWDYVLRYTAESSDGMNANWVKREIPNIGKGLATKSYMGYQSYTDKTAAGYDYLWGANSSDTSGGLRTYKSCYCVAMGSYYGSDGTFVKVEFDDGKTIYCVKADEKKDSETDAAHMYHASGDGSVIEFIVDNTKIDCSDVSVGNNQFTSALQAESINRSARITAIWTSTGEPTQGDAGTVSGEEKEYHFADTNEKISLHPTLFNQMPLQCEGKVKLVAGDMNISEHAGDISWTNTKDTLATVFNFSSPKADGMKYMNMYVPKIGDIVRFTGGETENFRGVIFEVDDGDNYVNKYTAADAGKYLSKTTDTYQFTAMRADECIKKICGDLNIPIAMLAELTKEITQIYIDKAVSDVIKDILEQCGDVYNFDFVPDGIRIYKCADMKVQPKFRISQNTALRDSVWFMGNTEHKVSIENMKNSVKVINDTDVIMVLKDEDGISKYGFLQTVVKIGENEDAAQTAKEQLEALDKEETTYSGEIIEELTSYTRAGSVIEKGGTNYLIKSSQHSIKNGVHYNKLDLEVL